MAVFLSLVIHLEICFSSWDMWEEICSSDFSRSVILVQSFLIVLSSGREKSPVVEELLVAIIKVSRIERQIVLHSIEKKRTFNSIGISQEERVT